MLAELAIDDLVLIAAARLEFSPVMTLRPGENSRRAAAMSTRSSIASSASIAAVEELLLDVLVEGPFGAHHEARQLRARGDVHGVAAAQAPHDVAVHDDLGLLERRDVAGADHVIWPQDDRPEPQRVRGDEVEHEDPRVPLDDGPATRQVVGGGPGGRGDDEPVAEHAAHGDPGDLVLELQHVPRGDPAEDDVVDGREAPAVDLDVDGEQLDDPVLPAEDALETAAPVVASKRREKADVAVVDAQRGHGAAEEAPERTQDRAVAADVCLVFGGDGTILR